MTTATHPASGQPNAQPAPGKQWFADFQREYESTRKLLERYPDGKGEWRPHEKSGTLSGVATHVAEITGFGVDILSETEFDIAKRQRPPRSDASKELVALADGNAAKLQKLLDGASVDQLNTVCTIKYGEHTIASGPRRILLRGFVMNHMIHHRGQLGVYLRLLGVPIPGMYGPSADEPM
jgi:uncharacterized damage-inducible protein DinB